MSGGSSGWSPLDWWWFEKQWDDVVPVAERVIQAKYPGHCAVDGYPFADGEFIGLVNGEWVCDQHFKRPPEGIPNYAEGGE